MKRIAIALAFPLALAACGKPDPGVLQGYVEGEFVRVAAPFPGMLVSLDVRRGAQVAAGAALFTLESERENAARNEAQERMRKAQATVDDLRKGKRPTEVDAVRAQLAQAEATASFSDKEYQRALGLVEKGFISPNKLDETRTARDRDRNRVVELANELATARLGARPDEIRAAEAEAAAARASLAQAAWSLKQKSVMAPVAGAVSDTLFAQGDYVAAGTPVVSLLPPANVKIRFFVPETRLAAVRVGQKVAVACDGCASTTAAITFIAPQAEFTPPVIYSKENRAKLVFLVEAKPSPEDAAKLHPGQPVDVTLP
jgi:HlyD family secretion protein